MIKDGRKHLASIRDGRRILIDGGSVGDVADHPAFRNAVATVGRLYDLQAAPETSQLMTFETRKGGPRVNRAWQLPKSYAELVERRKALTAWSEVHCGFMGRSPDHVASCVSGMAMGRELFEREGKGRGDALWSYYEYARDHDLYLAYVIIDPQADRSKATGEQKDEFQTAAICDEDSGGITIRGAKMLGTGAVMANEVLVASLRPVREGDAKYAFTAAVPIGTKGVKLLSRRSYEQAAVSRFDYPLSSAWDENDAIVYFDDVKVPWDRVFVHRNARMSPGAVPRDAGPLLPELPGADQPRREAAVPGRPGPPHRRDDRHRRFSAGARDPRHARFRGRNDRRLCACHGGQGLALRPLLHAGPGDAVFRSGAGPAALSARSSRRCVSWPAAA